MGVVESITISGYRFWFHSSDHLPPHFHCKKTSEWEVRIYFMKCSQNHGLVYDIKWGKDPSGKIKREINKLVLSHKVQLLKEWEEKVHYE